MQTAYTLLRKAAEHPEQHALQQDKRDRRKTDDAGDLPGPGPDRGDQQILLTDAQSDDNNSLLQRRD